MNVETPPPPPTEQWYYSRNGQQIGPVSRAVLDQMIATGQIYAGDLVWTDGMAQWQPVASVFPMPGPQPIPYGIPSYFDMRYAGFWRRFVAYILDMIIAAIIAAMIQLPFYLVLHPSLNDNEVLQQLIGLMVGWLYTAGFDSSTLQGTPGKLALSIYVTDLNGQRISFGRATGRHFAMILSALIFCIGFMMAGWTQRKQALHDMIAGCLVLRRE